MPDLRLNQNGLACSNQATTITTHKRIPQTIGTTLAFVVICGLLLVEMHEIHPCVRPSFAYTGAPIRSCLVSFTDAEGIEHSVRVSAESLFEAAVEAMTAFKHSVLAEAPLPPATRLTIRVKAPEEEHTVRVAKVLSWLDGVAISSSEKLKKNRLKERLRM